MSARKNKFIYAVLIIVISMSVAYLKFKILPDKYFYDSAKILNANIYGYVYDQSYNFAVSVFQKIDIFKFTTLQQWSYFLSIIFTFFLISKILRNTGKNLINNIYVYSSIILLNIYTFCISKDIIQFVFFLLIYFIIKNKKLADIKKIFLCCLIFLYEAIYFRSYYFIVATFTLTLFTLYKYFSKKSIYIKNSLRFIFIVFLFFFIEIYAVKTISSNSYYSIINARSSVNQYRLNSIDSVSIINDLLGKNTSFILFIGNYFINFFRMLFPFELLFKGIRYWPFIIYQIYISINIIGISKNLNDKNIILFSMFFSFLIVLIIFEPDFGSFIKHEITTFPILLDLISEKEELLERKNQSIKNFG